ncbi:hypothetical protein PALB_25770 [Pseudoalteromonas luteoviolacea B = ATCC 29581]|nr:hypothetical protein PALB_25770 [Pseudoalteromonas luteoviolacea B = ATCC 29581]
MIEFFKPILKQFSVNDRGASSRFRFNLKMNKDEQTLCCPKKK